MGFGILGTDAPRESLAPSCKGGAGVSRQNAVELEDDPPLEENTMSNRTVYVVAAARTAIGTFGGTLKDTPLADLATLAVKEALARSGAPADAVGHLAMGTVVPTEPRDAYLSRVAAVNCAARASRPSSRLRRPSCWGTARWPWAPVPKT